MRGILTLRGSNQTTVKAPILQCLNKSSTSELLPGYRRPSQVHGRRVLPHSRHFEQLVQVRRSIIRPEFVSGHVPIAQMECESLRRHARPPHNWLENCRYATPPVVYRLGENTSFVSQELSTKRRGQVTLLCPLSLALDFCQKRRRALKDEAQTDGRNAFNACS